MRMNRRNSPAWTQVRGEIAPWTARFDVFVKHRNPSKHNSYRHFAAQCSESESVYVTRSTKNVQALIFLDKKRTAIVLLSFRRRYFTMGIVKIYNVLGGFYVNYSITCHEKCLLSWCTNMHKFSIIFYAIYINLWNFPTTQSPQACHICQPAPQTALCTPLRTGISFPEPAGIFVPSTRCPGFPGSAAW